MARANYARRRRNAVLAAIVMALLFIIIVVIIIASISGGSSKKPTSSPTPTPTFNSGLFFPTPTLNNGLTTETTPTLYTPTPTPSTKVGTLMYVTGSSVNVREEASASGEKITSLKKGTSVTAYEKIGDFYSVKLSDGKTGYIAAAYLSQEKPDETPATTPNTTNGKKMYVTAKDKDSEINVRKAAKDGDVITKIKVGTEVTAYETKSGWTYIEYSKGKFGYISADYLTDKAPSTSEAPSSPSANTGTPTPTPTPTPVTSFAQMGVSQAIADEIDHLTVFLNKAKEIAAWKEGLYTIRTKQGSDVEQFYIVYEGTKDAPTNVQVTETKPSA